MDNKKKMKAMIKQMQSVIALVIIFVVASTICIKDGRNNFLDIRNLMNVLRAVSENGIRQVLNEINKNPVPWFL